MEDGLVSSTENKPVSGNRNNDFTYKVNGEKHEEVIALMEQNQKLIEELGRRESEIRILKEKIELDSRNLFELQRKFSPKMKLNVGGKIFCTSITTLTSSPNSMLAAMFSGRFPLEKDEEGSIFIDRDPTFFSNILDWLRDRKPQVVKNAREKKKLLEEANYFQLESFQALTLEEEEQMEIKSREEKERLAREEIRRQKMEARRNPEDQSKIGYRLSNAYSDFLIKKEQIQRQYQEEQRKRQSELTSEKKKRIRVIVEDNLQNLGEIFLNFANEGRGSIEVKILEKGNPPSSTSFIVPKAGLDLFSVNQDLIKEVLVNEYGFSGVEIKFKVEHRLLCMTLSWDPEN
jgi:hypothetical protein